VTGLSFSQAHQNTGDDTDVPNYVSWHHLFVEEFHMHISTLAVLIISTIASLGSANAQSNSLAVQTIANLGLHEFYCSYTGRTQDAQPINVGGTSDIFATDEAEAMKLCLSKLSASTFGEADGSLILLVRDSSYSNQAIIVNDISIRKGQM
jgi:hypothetical protein